MPPLHLLVKPASGLCNMRCEYCFYHDIAQKREQASYGIMNDTTQENMMQRAFDYAEGQITIAYQGGEPTLAGLDYFRRGAELQAKYNAKRIPVYNAIQTNGLGLGEDWARFFAENNYLVGLSIDGAKDTHDRYRLDSAGKGTFARVMKTAQMFDRFGVQYNVLTVVNAATARHINSAYSFFKRSGFKYLQFIPCLDPLGEAAGGKDYSLTNEAFAGFMKRLFDAWYNDIEKGEGVSIRTFDNYISMLMGYPPESCGMSGVCSAQNVVEADGAVYPCDFYVIDNLRLGNLNDCGFDEIENRRSELRFVETSAQFSMKCQECEYFGICRGGCRRMRGDIAGDIPSNIYCEAYREFFEYALERMVRLADRLSRQRAVGR